MISKTESITSAELVALVDDDDGELTKAELDRLILEKVGTAVNEDILGMIFEECDEDESGRVTFDELAGYINSIQKPTNGERARSVTISTVLSIPFPPLLCFIAGLGTDVALNIIDRTEKGVTSDFNFYGFNAILYLLGFCVYVAMAYDASREQVELIERANQKLVLWATKGFHKTGDTPVKAVDESSKMTVADLKVTLEESNVFLTLSVLKKVFRRIDDDHSGAISFSEIKDYADVQDKKGKATGLALHRLTLAKCFRSFDFWLSWVWILGAILFVIGSYATLSDDALLHVNGVGCICFLTAAIFQFRSYFKGVNGGFNYAQELNLVLRSLAERSGNAGKLEAQTGPVDDATVKEAARDLFAKIDVGGSGGNGNLDFIELYDALTNAGFVVQLDVLQQVFSKADKSGDGELQVDEFIQFITSIKEEVSLSERVCDILNSSICDFFFWTLLMQLAGGILITVGNYANIADPGRLSNVYLAGALMWLLPMLNYLYEEFKGNAIRFNAIAYSKNKFKDDIIKGARNANVGEAMEKRSDQFS